MSAAVPHKARIAVVGAGWWAQGWHLPHLQHNRDAVVAAIVEPSEAPTAWTKEPLETRTALLERYGLKRIHQSLDEFLADVDTLNEVDGVIVCTPHAMHAEMGMKLLAAGKHVLMEKPMTVDVMEARALADAATATAPRLAFMVNNSANFRDHCFDARGLVDAGAIGEVHHCLCVMYSPLLFLFDDPANTGWVEATGSMLCNGFGWGQLSHLLAWVLYVTALDPVEAHCITHTSTRSGADLTDAALIRCASGASISLSGSCGWPGNEHGREATGKHFDIKIFGSKGVLTYGGNDKEPSSGRLELRTHDGVVDTVREGFYMENCERGGSGPESLVHFIAACRGLPFRNGADQHIGLQAVRVLDAMYRSAASGKGEPTR